MTTIDKLKAAMKRIFDTDNGLKVFYQRQIEWHEQSIEQWKDVPYMRDTLRWHTEQRDEARAKLEKL